MIYDIGAVRKRVQIVIDKLGDINSRIKIAIRNIDKLSGTVTRLADNELITKRNRVLKDRLTLCQSQTNPAKGDYISAEYADNLILSAAVYGYAVPKQFVIVGVSWSSGAWNDNDNYHFGSYPNGLYHNIVLPSFNSHRLAKAQSMVVHGEHSTGVPRQEPSYGNYETLLPINTSATLPYYGVCTVTAGGNVTNTYTGDCGGTTTETVTGYGGCGGVDGTAGNGATLGFYNNTTDAEILQAYQSTEPTGYACYGDVGICCTSPTYRQRISDVLSAAGWSYRKRWGQSILVEYPYDELITT